MNPSSDSSELPVRLRTLVAGEEVLAAVQQSGAKVVMPLKTQFYGMREFAFQDPEGWIVTMAERVK